MFERELNEYWKTVVDTIQDGIMIVDKENSLRFHVQYGGHIVKVRLILLALAHVIT